ncbi:MULTISPECIES: TnsA-like heteromeric transposase endonuclease subunit [Micrococcales]|uniref:TnsA-like heteromeric transposase endonuclease subunit n=1 Tax=Micrococcales TaxID=85006 RepID=UPI0038401593
MSSSAWAVERPGCGVPVMVNDDGTLMTLDLSEAATWRFEDHPGIRKPVAYKGQRNWVGSWWFSKSGEYVPFESWVERDWIMLFDRDANVRAVRAQPFTLDLPSGRHTPDFFLRRRDGSVEIIDVRPDDRIGDVDALKFAQTADACSLVGWSYQRVGEVEPVARANCRWLSAYRHPWCGVSRVTSLASITQALAGERVRLDEVSARLGAPLLAVLPLVFHHVWRGDLRMDESVPFSLRSPVWEGSAA